MPKLEIWWCAKEEVLPGSAAFGLAYTCAHAWWVDDTTVVNAVVGWTATRYYVFVLCRARGKISLGIYTHWAVWHAAGHLLMLVGSIALASGNVEDKFRLSLSIWPRNCWVETGAAFVLLACFAYDSSIAFRTVRLRKVKLTD